MFTRLITSALFAGFVAGLIAALLQLYFVQPVLLHAELYESGDLVHFGSNATSHFHVDLGSTDLGRDALSIFFSALVYVGYGLMLLAAMALAEDQGADITPRNGILWGLAGFLAFHFLPGFSLPPELPGSAAADVTPRQIWWFSTAAAAIVAFWLIAFNNKPITWVIAAALLLAPHVIGAPHPDVMTGPVPPELAALYASRALGVGMAVWVLLGLLSGYFWQREAAE